MIVPSHTTRSGAAVAAVLVTLLALIFRLYDLERLPAGLNADEAWNALDALRVSEGAGLRPFYPGNTGREGLYITLVSMGFRLMGASEHTLRLVSALLGAGTVFLFHAALRRIYGTRVALVGGLIAATSVWHIVLSRSGYRAVTLPFAMALGLLALGAYSQARGQRARHSLALVSGLVLALHFYTYTSAFALPVALLLAPGLLWARNELRPRVTDLALASVGLALGIIPLALALSGPDGDVFRSKLFGLSLTSGDADPAASVRTLAGNYLTSLGGFLLRGSPDAEYNVPFLPFLYPLAAAGLAGATVSLAGAVRALGVRRPIPPRDAVTLLLGIAFLVELLPGAASTATPPSGVQLVGALVPAWALAGLGLDRFIGHLGSGRWRAAAIGLIGVSATLHGGYWYLVRGPRDGHFDWVYRADAPTAVQIILAAELHDSVLHIATADRLPIAEFYLRTGAFEGATHFLDPLEPSALATLPPDARLHFVDARELAAVQARYPGLLRAIQPGTRWGPYSLSEAAKELTSPARWRLYEEVFRRARELGKVSADPALGPIAALFLSSDELRQPPAGVTDLCAWLTEQGTTVLVSEANPPPSCAGLERVEQIRGDSEAGDARGGVGLGLPTGETMPLEGLTWRGHYLEGAEGASLAPEGPSLALALRGLRSPTEYVAEPSIDLPASFEATVTVGPVASELRDGLWLGIYLLSEDTRILLGWEQREEPVGRALLSAWQGGTVTYESVVAGLRFPKRLRLVVADGVLWGEVASEDGTSSLGPLQLPSGDGWRLGLGARSFVALPDVALRFEDLVVREVKWDLPALAIYRYVPSTP